MIINTKEFQDAANKILLAVGVDKAATTLELAAKETEPVLYLRVTNKEYFVSVRFSLDMPTEFRATVEAPLFLNLISGISTETFELDVKGNAIVVKSGKSSYKLPMIYEGTELMKLTPIKLDPEKDKITAKMSVSKDILNSILTVNSKEIQKAKTLAKVSDLSNFYYVDETGCFTFTYSACVNAFTLEQPVKLLLNERIVKLFKLFDSDVHMWFGQTSSGTSNYAILILGNQKVTVSAKIPTDERLINTVRVSCDAMKNIIKMPYDNVLVVSAQDLSNAIARLVMFTKNSVEKADLGMLPVDVSFTADELILTDNTGNREVITVENTSVVDSSYTMTINLADLKYVIDSCKNEHVTISCGNHKAVVITRGTISNVIPEARKKEN